MRMAAPLGVLLLISVLGGDAAASDRRVRVARVVLSGGLPLDLVEPEGRSRWDLASVATDATWVRSLEIRRGSVRLVDEGHDGEPRVRSETVADPAGGDAATEWLLPDRAGPGLRMGTRSTLDLEVSGAGAVERVSARVEVVGIGWVHLPSGPREVVLQRVLLLRGPVGGRGLRPDSLVHRWVDPRAGVVAEVAGPAAPDGRSRVGVGSATVVEEVLAGATGLKIYVDELEFPALDHLNYGRDPADLGTCRFLQGSCQKDPSRSCSSNADCILQLDEVTDPPFQEFTDLVAASSWSFDVPGNRTGTRVAQTNVTLTPDESCNEGLCGYVSGSKLGRVDRNYDAVDPDDVVKSNQVTEREDRVGDVTIWLRAGAQKEGIDECFGTGESRFCHTGNDGSGKARAEVPLWRMGHEDADGWFLQAGDSWTSGPLDCAQNIFNEICGNAPSFPFCPTPRLMRASGNCANHAGEQRTEVLKEGVITIPSGHTLNALLVRTVADFCVYGNSDTDCSAPVSNVRTVIYLWQVPHLGTVVLLQSPQVAPPNLESYSDIEESMLTVGLYPPVSIEVTGATDTSVDISWDPGKDAGEIDDYKVYWDTQSGTSSTYGSSATCDTGQVSCSGTSATVSGLDPGTTYFFTVTALAEYTNPSTGATTPYESLLFPTQVSGDPGFVYPVEVQGTTTGGTCIPTQEVSGLTVGKSGADIEICWGSTTDPCAVGYDILGAHSPEAAGNFTTIAQTGLETCWTGSPSESYFLVVTRGTGGTGPWGHFDR